MSAARTTDVASPRPGGDVGPSSSQRRNACPGLFAPLPTGDGLLARLVPAGPIGVDAFRRLCAAGRRYGNGIIEISARGSVQVRGLSPRSAPRFAAEIASLGIAAAGVPVIPSPLDEPDAVLDAGALANGLRAAIAELHQGGLVIAPKISVVVDGGGRLHLDAVPADIRLRAVGSPAAPQLWVGIGRNGPSAIWLGVIAPDDAATTVTALLRAVAAIGPAARGSDLLAVQPHGEAGAGAAAIRIGDGALSLVLRPVSSGNPLPRPPAAPIGVHRLRDGAVALGVALAFGHADADALAGLAAAAAAYGATAVRPAPSRALLLLGIAERDAAALAEAAWRIGFVTSPDDPRRHIVACPGTPACASGLIPARAMAAALAPLLAAVEESRGRRPGTGDQMPDEPPPSSDPRHPPSAVVHLSGCRKGCAHPAPAAVTVVGTQHGCGIVRDGSAQAEPCRFVETSALLTHVTAEVARTTDAAGRAAEPARHRSEPAGKQHPVGAIRPPSGTVHG